MGECLWRLRVMLRHGIQTNQSRLRNRSICLYMDQTNTQESKISGKSTRISRKCKVNSRNRFRNFGRCILFHPPRLKARSCKPTVLFWFKTAFSSSPKRKRATDGETTRCKPCSAFMQKMINNGSWNRWPMMSQNNNEAAFFRRHQPE